MPYTALRKAHRKAGERIVGLTRRFTPDLNEANMRETHESTCGAEQVRSGPPGPRPKVLPERRRSRLLRSALASAGVYALLTAIAVIMAGPFVWMLLSSFKPNQELFAYPPVWIPTRITFEHFINAFRYTNFARYFLNSTIVSVTATLLNLFFCSLAGYAFARLDFPGKNLIFFAILATMMIPVYVTLIPLFILVKRFPLAGGNNLFGQNGTGLINTYWGLVLPYVVSVFGVFLTRQFFSSIPTELNDAARVDGASEFAIYSRIYLPLSRPVLATLAIFSFTGVWDDFLWPLVITNSEHMRTVQLGLQIFRSQFLVDWGPLMAATLVVTLPVLLIFIFNQRHFVKGVVTTGLKG
ncbi:MAG: multiple sugar transport system permease protein [Bacillota bacterium]|nr:multiple sugar transport system permease protein [Bacillota bacterium]